MSKFKFITLAASIMLAIAFTISCSDDKDEGGNNGSLDGTWQKGDVTNEINGTQVISYLFGTKYKGTIKYNGSSGTWTVDFWWDGQKWQAMNKDSGNFSYTLSADGKTLTISGDTNEDGMMNGVWTKID